MGSIQKPAPPDLDGFPAQLGNWQMAGEETLATDVQRALGADRILNRRYVLPGGALPASLLITWFQSQGSGLSQPHSPKVCLPGAGYVPEQVSEATIPTTMGSISVNRYLVSKGHEKVLVLYWYQTGTRVEAGEWASKVLVVADALRTRKTDVALIRVTVPVATGQVASAEAAATSLASAVFPMAAHRLPQ